MIEWIKKHHVISKTIALLTAVLFWYFVLSIENPEITFDYANIDVQLEGISQLDANALAIVEGADASVDVQIRGPRDNMTQLTADKVSVTLNVSTISAPGEYNLNYSIAVDVPNVTVVSKSPAQIALSVDRMISRAVPVTLDMTGAPAEEFALGGYTLSPDAVVIYGPETQVNAVERAYATFDLGDATDSVSTSLTYVLQDAEGNEVNTGQMTLDTPSVLLETTIEKHDNVPLIVDFLDTDYLTSDMVTYTVEPEAVLISGDPDTIDHINHIPLGNINLGNMVETGVFEVTLPLVLPNGIVPVDEVPSSATVTVTVPGYERTTLTLQPSDLPQVGIFSYIQMPIAVQLFGPSEQIEGLNAQSFGMTLQYVPEALVLGENTIGLTLSLPTAPDVHILGDYLVTVRVDELPEQIFE